MPSCRKYRLPLGSPLPFQLFNQNYQGKREITLFQNYSLLYSTQHGHIYFECSPGDCMTLYIDEAHRANKTTMGKYIQNTASASACAVHIVHIYFICASAYAAKSHFAPMVTCSVQSCGMTYVRGGASADFTSWLMHFS